MTRILLLYNGYPRLSQTYQIDEADELAARYGSENLLIISWDWTLYTVKEQALPYIHQHPLEALTTIRAFSPDIIHAHYLTNAELCFQLSELLNVPFTIRTHSFDVFGPISSLRNHRTYIDSERCLGVLAFPAARARLIQSGYDPLKIHATWPSVDIGKFRALGHLPNGQHIMSGGALLPKKDIPGFIQLAAKIKTARPDLTISYYTVQEDPTYYDKVMRINERFGMPVQFVTCQPHLMPAEYKNHQWLVYGACPKLATVGYPLMVAEAQASGVGVIMYDLRPDSKEYVTEAGYMYKTHDDVLSIISQDFPLDKKTQALELSSRYDIKTNITVLTDLWHPVSQQAPS